MMFRLGLCPRSRDIWRCDSNNSGAERIRATEVALNHIAVIGVPACTADKY
jgi:hypothetical protein